MTTSTDNGTSSLYIHARPVRGGAEIEIEDSNPARLERLVNWFQRTPWIQRDGKQQSLFSNAVTLSFFLPGKNSKAQADEVLSQLRCV